ncbi:MAG TPA: hypothetical protein P5527_00590 [Kiritimatiellia bacterium]|jgi:hypothetical protein|nr:hypothetical protein [Kiritimatiellia bacterium]
MKDAPFALDKLSPQVRMALGITGVALVAGVAIIVFGIKPTYQRVKTLTAEVAQLGVKHATMKTDITGTQKQRAATEAAEAALKDILDEGVIEPLLGSFSMRGKSLLDPLAEEAGFTIVNIREDRLIPLQVPNPPPQQLYARQLVELTGYGAYTQIVAFVQAAEQTFPLAVVSGLRIEHQMPTPERHKATITFEWPVKGEKRK